MSESALTSRVKAARRAVGDDGQAAAGHQDRPRPRVPVRRRRAHRPRPHPATHFPRLRNAPIGRDGDIGSVVERIRAAPLVTITGSGGIGKTTVALAVAERLQAEYADGVVFVDLSPVPPQADVTRAVAEAAGVEGAASETIERVADHLANRPVLLVLDNCEHVARAAPPRSSTGCSSAAMRCTSWPPAGSRSVWPVSTSGRSARSTPPGRRCSSSAPEPPSPGCGWDAADPAVVELCRRLDDVPLALELAAGQLRRFDLDELNRRLDDRLALQWGPSAGDTQRHATMETAIDWSYRLLDRDGAVPAPAPQRLPVVVRRPRRRGEPPLRCPARCPSTVFGQLVDKSLVVRLPGSGRYRLLETIRVFGRDRLDESGEAASAFERHRRHVRDRIGSASRLDRWMSARLGAEFRNDLDDARQAFRLSLQHGERRRRGRDRRRGIVPLAAGVGLRRG